MMLADGDRGKNARWRCRRGPARPSIVTFAWFALDADAAHDDVLHVRRLFFGDRARFAFETGAHFEWDAELFRELDRARLHDLGTGARHLEQFVVGDFVDLLRLGDDARIAGEDAIDVGENLAGVGVRARRPARSRSDRSRRGRALSFRLPASVPESRRRSRCNPQRAIRESVAA